MHRDHIYVSMPSNAFQYGQHYGAPNLIQWYAQHTDMHHAHYTAMSYIPITYYNSAVHTIYSACINTLPKQQ